MAKKIVLIACCKTKLNVKAQAKELYTSALFKKSFAYANLLKPDHIFILSAEHKLLAIDAEIEPYENTLNTKSSKEIKSWASDVLQQIELKGFSLECDEFVFLAADCYRKYLIKNMKKISIPLDGLRIGEQLKKLNELIS